MFASFLPAVSRDALVAMGRQVRRWRVHLRTGGDLADLARWMNPIVRGWMQYYGAFNRSELYPLLRRINTYLVRWARKKYRALHGSKAMVWWRALVARYPRGFAQWAWTRDFLQQGGKSRVTGDCHARFCGSRGVRFPPATRLDDPRPGDVKERTFSRMI